MHRAENLLAGNSQPAELDFEQSASIYRGGPVMLLNACENSMKIG